MIVSLEHNDSMVIKKILADRDHSWSLTAAEHIRKSLADGTSPAAWRWSAGVADTFTLPRIVSLSRQDCEFEIASELVVPKMVSISDFRMNTCIETAVVFEKILKRIVWHHQCGYFHANISPDNVALGEEILPTEADENRRLFCIFWGLRPSRLAVEDGIRRDIADIGWMLYWILCRFAGVDAVSDCAGVDDVLAAIRPIIKSADRGSFVPSRLVDLARGAMDGEISSAGAMLQGLRSSCLRWEGFGRPSSNTAAEVGVSFLYQGDMPVRIVSIYQLLKLASSAKLLSSDQISLRHPGMLRSIADIDELSEFGLSQAVIP